MFSQATQLSNLTKLLRLLISNTFLRWTLRPYSARLRALTLCCDARLKCRLKQGIKGILPSPADPSSGRRTTWSCGAPACARLA